MRTILMSAVALGALTSVSFADPVSLTDKQLDGVTAGLTAKIGDVLYTTTGDNNSLVAFKTNLGQAVAEFKVTVIPAPTT